MDERTWRMKQTTHIRVDLPTKKIIRRKAGAKDMSMNQYLKRLMKEEFDDESEKKFFNW